MATMAPLCACILSTSLWVKASIIVIEPMLVSVIAIGDLSALDEDKAIRPIMNLMASHSRYLPVCCILRTLSASEFAQRVSLILPH